VKLTPYVETVEDAAVLADSLTPFRRIEDRAVQLRVAEVMREVDDKPMRVTDGNLKEDIAYKLGYMAGLAWRNKLIEAAEERMKGT
jgi:hypothetical protein